MFSILIHSVQSYFPSLHLIPVNPPPLYSRHLPRDKRLGIEEDRDKQQRLFIAKARRGSQQQHIGGRRCLLNIQISLLWLVGGS